MTTLKFSLKNAECIKIVLYKEIYAHNQMFLPLFGVQFQECKKFLLVSLSSITFIHFKENVLIFCSNDESTNNLT